MTKFQGKSRTPPILKAVPEISREADPQADPKADIEISRKTAGEQTFNETTLRRTDPAQDRGAEPSGPASGPQPLQGMPAPLSLSAQMASPALSRLGGGMAMAGLRRPPARPGAGGETGATTGSGARLSTAPPAIQPASVAPAPPRPAAMAGQAGSPANPPEGLPMATAAEVRPRHRGILASFVALVLLPVLASAAYLWLVAQDQYASTLGFSVRTEEISSSLDLLGGITRLSGGGSSDSDILYDYIHSQELVQDLDAEIDLRGIYAQAWPQDPVFAFDPDSTIEDLVAHWERTVRITYDSSSGLMTLRVLAFTPEQATRIAEHILDRSTEKINALAAEARDDATRYARIEMDRALERLKGAREAMTGFRIRTQMVDPAADLQGQMGVLNNLQARLAESYIELDLLRVTTNANDPRIIQAEQRIVVIRNRIEEERRKFSESESIPGGEDYATMVSEFERLSVDREFAEQAYRVALAAYDGALAEAQRKSRYLAAHIRPTQAEKSEYPQRWTLLGLTGFFLFAAWAIGVLVFYSIRDRR